MSNSQKLTGDEPYFPFFSGSDGYWDAFTIPTLGGAGNTIINFNQGITIKQKFIMDFLTRNISENVYSAEIAFKEYLHAINA